jgi:hypothetical protein
MSRAYRNQSGETRLDSFHDYDRTPSAFMAHKGTCACGVETSRNVTRGPAGSPLNGWECHACGEAYLRAQFDRAPK